MDRRALTLILIGVICVIAAIVVVVDTRLGHIPAVVVGLTLIGTLVAYVGYKIQWLKAREQHNWGID